MQPSFRRLHLRAHVFAEEQPGMSLEHRGDVGALVHVAEHLLELEDGLRRAHKVEVYDGGLALEHVRDVGVREERGEFARPRRRSRRRARRESSVRPSATSRPMSSSRTRWRSVASFQSRQKRTMSTSHCSVKPNTSSSSSGWLPSRAADARAAGARLPENDRALFRTGGWTRRKIGLGESRAGRGATKHPRGDAEVVARR